MGYAAPGIILAGQQPQPVSPLANLSQVLQAKDTLSQIGQRQALQQNIQAEADQRNRDLADQNTIQESMKDPDQWARINTGDLSGLAGKIQPKTMDSVQAAILANHQKLLTNTAEQNTIREKALGEINNTITGLRSLPPKADGTPDVDRINAALPGAISRLNDAGYFKQAGIDPSKLPQQITDPQQLETTQALLGGELAAHETIAKQQSEAAKLKETQSSISKNTAQATQAGAEANKANVEATEAPKKTAIEQARLDLENKKFGFDSSGGISETAKAIANGTLDPQTTRAMLRREPGLINQVKIADPNFDEAQIEDRFNTLKEFTNTSNSKAGGQLLALNTLIHHANLYSQVADSLKNGSFKPGNAVYNAVATAFGSAPPTDTNLVARFLAGETGKVATGGVPAQSEVEGMLKNLSTSNSPEQIKQSADTLLQVAAGRAGPLMQRIHDAKLDNVIHAIDPDTATILQQHGFDPQTMKKGAAPTATPKTVPPEVQAFLGIRRAHQVSTP